MIILICLFSLSLYINCFASSDMQNIVYFLLKAAKK